MCLRIEPNQESSVAQEDITVYKVMRYRRLTGKWFSPYRMTKYNLNQFVTSIMQYGHLGADTIEAGLHSFATREDAQYLRDLFISTYENYDYHILICKIPKGAQYYLGTFRVKTSEETDGYTDLSSYASNTLYVGTKKQCDISWFKRKLFNFTKNW